jgi:hypothetical protein
MRPLEPNATSCPSLADGSTMAPGLLEDVESTSASPPAASPGQEDSPAGESVAGSESAPSCALRRTLRRPRKCSSRQREPCSTPGIPGPRGTRGPLRCPVRNPRRGGSLRGRRSPEGPGRRLPLRRGPRRSVATGEVLRERLPRSCSETSAPAAPTRSNRLSLTLG